MHVDRSRSGSRSSPAREPLRDQPVVREPWDQALAAHRAEDWETSLRATREILARGPRAIDDGLSLVPAPDQPRLTDVVLLAARNLLRLDRQAEFALLRDEVATRDIGPENWPALEAVRLAFACKHGEYAQVVRETTDFIDTHRAELPPVIADYLYQRGLAHTHLGNPEPGREDTEAAHALFRLLGRESECGRSANLLGILHLKAARFAEAERWFRQALDIHTRLGAHRNAGGNRLNIAITIYKRGRPGTALNELTAARRLLAGAGAAVPLCRAALATGCAQLLKGDPAAATATLLTAYEDAGRLRLAREESLALEFLGDAQAATGQHAKARRYYSRALAVARTMAPEGDVVMEVLRRQGASLAAQGRQTEAVPVLSRALGLARRLADRFEEGATRRVLAEALLGLGDLEAAAAAADQAARVLEEIDAGLELAQARRCQARIGLARLDAGHDLDREGTLEAVWRHALSALDHYLRAEVDREIRRSRSLLAEVSQRRISGSVATLAETPSPRGSIPEHVIVHASPALRDAIQLCDAFADSAEPVLVTGPTGTGKELFARRLHARSPRRGGELVCVNVSAIPRGLFAREFFGHVRGAFSGAAADARGFAERADGGTLFLDEIGDLPLELQPQLLRLLQDGTFQAIGDPSERRVDLRLVASTNAELGEMVAAGSFRADLYYRLKILELRLPPLRKRPMDVVPLLQHFLVEAAKRPVLPTEYFSAASLELMERHSWPGNAREVAMVARQAHVQLVSRGEVRVEVGVPGGEILTFTGPHAALEEAMPPLVRGIAGRGPILMALAEAGGNRAEAARLLGVSRSTLYRRLERLGIGVKSLAG